MIPWRFNQNTLNKNKLVRVLIEVRADLNFAHRSGPGGINLSDTKTNEISKSRIFYQVPDAHDDLEEFHETMVMF